MDDRTGFEERLARLAPAEARLDRERLMFEAGRAAGRAETRRRVAYPLATAALVAMAAAVTLIVRLPNGPSTSNEPVVASTQVRTQSSASVDARYGPATAVSPSARRAPPESRAPLPLVAWRNQLLSSGGEAPSEIGSRHLNVADSSKAGQPDSYHAILKALTAEL